MPATPLDHSIARAFTALAHHNRARLFRTLTVLKERRASYSELMQMTGMSDATLTHHLRVMETSRLVRRQRKGVVVDYVLDTDVLHGAMTTTAQLSGTGPAKVA